MSVPERLIEIQRRIAAACQRAGRDPEEIVLVPVSKRQPIERLRAAIDVGITLFGENQVQEATQKSADLPPDLDWHLIGPLQSNKVRPAVRLFSTIHSIGPP